VITYSFITINVFGKVFNEVKDKEMCGMRRIYPEGGMREVWECDEESKTSEILPKRSLWEI